MPVRMLERFALHWRTGRGAIVFVARWRSQEAEQQLATGDAPGKLMRAGTAHRHASDAVRPTNGSSANHRQPQEIRGDAEEKSRGVKAFAFINNQNNLHLIE